MVQRIAYIIGFACYLTLISFLGWSNTFALSQLSVEHVVNSQTYSFVKTLFNIGTYCAIAMWGTMAVITKRSSNRLFVGALVLSFAGAVIVYFSSTHSLWLLVILSAAFIGIGQALFFLAWQLIFAHVDSERPYVLPALATGLGALLYLGIITISTEQILELVSVLLLPAIGVFYVICARASEKEAMKGLQECEKVDRESSAFWESNCGVRGKKYLTNITKLPLSLRRNLLASFLVFMCVAFMWAMMRSYSSGPSVTSDTLTVVGRLVSAVLIMLVFRYVKKQVTVLSLFQFVFPVLAIGFILLPVFNSAECNIVVSVLAYTVHSMISIVAMVECRQLYLAYGISPLTSVGIAWGGVGVVTVMGRSIGALSVEFNFVITLMFIVVYVVFQILFFRIGKQDHNQTQVAIDKTNPNAEERDDLTNFSSRYGLTPREEEVLELLLKGRTSKQIADKLYVSNNTVLTHLKNIYRKTEVHSKTQIVDLFEAEAESKPAQRD